jgi:NADH-quinone oxidoreductase subunit M
MIGLPGLSGFPGEFSALLGAYKASPWLTFFAFISVIGAAAYALTAFQKVFHQEAQVQPVPDLSPKEWVFSVASVLVIVLMGMYPKLFLQYLTEFGKAVAAIVGGAS